MGHPVGCGEFRSIRCFAQDDRVWVGWRRVVVCYRKRYPTLRKGAKDGPPGYAVLVRGMDLGKRGC
jgi:hypothetical protein